MASVSIYLNFDGKAEEAFNFYRSVFGGEFEGQGIMRMKEMPPEPGAPELPEAVKNQVLHVSLPIINGFQLMGSDAPEAFTGRKLAVGNNTYINLLPDTREEADRLFGALSEGGEIEMEMADMFWGDYFGSFTDRFGVRWMIACPSKS